MKQLPLRQNGSTDDDAAWWVSVPEAEGPRPEMATSLLLANRSRTRRVIGFRGGLVEVRPAVKVQA